MQFSSRGYWSAQINAIILDVLKKKTQTYKLQTYVDASIENTLNEVSLAWGNFSLAHFSAPQ